jgi:transposase
VEIRLVVIGDPAFKGFPQLEGAGPFPPPTSSEVQTWYARMVHLLAQYGHRRDEAGTLARTLEREMGALWTFVVEEEVEPTNNRAERALRFAVLWRKMMQGTYNE